MKILIFFLSTFFIFGCSINPVIDFGGYKYSKDMELGTLYWDPVRTNDGHTRAYATTRLHLTSKQNKTNDLIWFSTNFINIAELGSDNPKWCADKNDKLQSEINYFSIYFSRTKQYPKQYNNFTYMFDSAKSYIIKDNQKIQLKEVSIGDWNDKRMLYKQTRVRISTGLIKYSTYEIIRSQTVYYKSPFVCEDLEGVELEIGGLSVNGVEAPPLRFNMNYKKYIKKKWKNKST